MFDGIVKFDSGLGKSRKLSAEEIAALPDKVRTDLNLVYKKWGGGRFLAIRLNSFASKDGERVTKVLLELGTTDKSDKLQDCVKIYMDIPKFTYLCEMMKSGRLRTLVEESASEVRARAVNEAKEDAEKKGLERPDYKAFLPNFSSFPVFEDYGGSESECRILTIYTGYDYRTGKRNERIVFDAQKGPGRKGAKGQISPDRSRWTKENSTKVVVGFTDQELGEAGMAGLAAMDILNLWSAMGVLEERLSLINPRWERRERREDYKESRNSRYDGGHNMYDRGRYDNYGYQSQAW